jgi:hypothetical protein
MEMTQVFTLRNLSHDQATVYYDCNHLFTVISKQASRDTLWDPLSSKHSLAYFSWESGSIFSNRSVTYFSHCFSTITRSPVRSDTNDSLKFSGILIVFFRSWEQELNMAMPKVTWK